jgi:histidine decarboxylase
MPPWQVLTCRFWGRIGFQSGADSIAVSGHKFIGSPIPCGIIMVKKSNRDRIGQSISYIGNMDTTISGSRNAITPVFLWYRIAKLGKAGLMQRASDALALAEYTVKQLQSVGVAVWRNQNALTVVFPKPSERICHKWQLASDGDLSHLICMPGVTKEQIDAFVLDYKEWKEQLVDCIIEPTHYRLN